MKEIRLKARAKINISLDIIGKRENGYHDVEMIMQTINLYDRLIMRKTKKPTIRIKTNLPYLPVDERNLVYKIIDYMRRQYSIREGLYVDLYKMIPVAAGLAGGSSDAAQTIIGMNKLFALGLTVEEMMDIGAMYGSDIPYCILQGTALATGLGEILEPLSPFPMMNVLIVKPKFSMSTASVYQQFDLSQVVHHPKTRKLIEAIDNSDKSYICDHLENVLETVTVKMHPELETIKQELSDLGANGVLMSGSGPTIYGLFWKQSEAEGALRRMKKERKIQFTYLTTVYNRKKG